jgi:hypothetical protein
MATAAEIDAAEAAARAVFAAAQEQIARERAAEIAASAKVAAANQH